jgi:hypothetical protein
MARRGAARTAPAVVLALLVAAPACRKTPEPAADGSQAQARQPGALPPPTQLDEVEPNDAQHAQGVPERAIVSGSIAPPRRGAADDDWYRITPGPGRLLALRVELGPRAAGGAAQLDASLEVYDRDRNRVLRTRATAAEPALVPAVACLEACFVRISGTAPAAYKLTLLAAPPRDGEELEPNDRAVDATPLAAGAAAQGTFFAPDDEDWYRVVAAAPKPDQFLRAEVSAVPGVRPELELRSLSDGALLATFRAPAAGEGIALRDLALPLPAPAPAEAAADAGGGAAIDSDAGTPASAGAAADAAPVAAPVASNPVPAAAPAAAPTATASPAPAVSASPAPTASAGPAPTASAGPAPVLPLATPAAGYYFVLRPGWVSADKPGGRPRRVADPRTPYALRTSLEAGPPDLEQEPNDDPAHATDLSGGSRSGYLSPAGDVDWYRIRAAVPSLLRVEVSALQRADVELSVWLPAARPGDKPVLLARANEGGVREGEILPAVGIPAGDALVKVESAQRNLDGKWLRDGEDRDTLYRLTASLVPDDGAHDREPNDDLAHAQVVALPAKVTGTIWPKRDVDVYRFRVSEGHPPLDLRVSAVRGVDLMLTLREVRQGRDGQERAEIIGTADQVRGEGEEALLSVPLKAGDYTVEVSSPRKEASASQPYTLTIADSP